jgi:hypothetical protein
VHVIPRHDSDGLDHDAKRSRWVSPEERRSYAERLEAELSRTA